MPGNPVSALVTALVIARPFLFDSQGINHHEIVPVRQKALFAIFYAILFIAIYISGRFELKWLMSIVMALSLAFVVWIACTAAS